MQRFIHSDQCCISFAKELSSKLLAWSLVRKVDHRIEPVTIGIDRFNHDDISPLVAIVKKEGIMIRC